MMFVAVRIFALVTFLISISLLWGGLVQLATYFILVAIFFAVFAGGSIEGGGVCTAQTHNKIGFRIHKEETTSAS